MRYNTENRFKSGSQDARRYGGLSANELEGEPDPRVMAKARRCMESSKIQVFANLLWARLYSQSQAGCVSYREKSAFDEQYEACLASLSVDNIDQGYEIRLRGYVDKLIELISCGEFEFNLNSPGELAVFSMLGSKEEEFQRKHEGRSVLAGRRIYKYGDVNLFDNKDVVLFVFTKKADYSSDPFNTGRLARVSHNRGIVRK